MENEPTEEQQQAARGLLYAISFTVALTMVIAVLAQLLTGCATIPPPKPIDGAATCATMCSRAREMKCDYAEATPEGASCDEVCAAVMDSGTLGLDLECRTMAATCATAEECEAE